MSAPLKPTKEFSTRYDAAKKWRDVVQPSLEEILSYICPGREHDFDRAQTDPRSDEQETFISLPEEMATDFAADLVTYYCPAEARWTEYLVTAPVPEDQVDQVKTIVDTREEDIFDMIQASNFNDISPQIMFEANHGTAAMWVEQGHFTQPVFMEAVPPHELLITPGHRGILDRFREKWVLASTLPALFAGWEGISLTDLRLQNKISKPGEKSKVCWGFWLDWTDPGFPLWRCEVTVDKIRVTPSTPLVLGPLAGTCPLLVGRFNPQTGRPWGRGPGWKALPDMRVYNAVDEAVLDGLDQSLKNTLIYADDGFIDLSEGLEAGRAYPASRGFTREQIFEMQRGVNLDMGFFSEDRLEERIRERFYQDGPRQRGDTPPTASQWIDERRRVQARIGKPSAPLWKELFLPLIQRVEYLGVQAGKLDAELTHNEDVISAQPVSPLQKAQNQDKVMVSKSNLDTGFAVFGEAIGQVVDVQATLQNHIRASGDELTVIRKEPQGETPPQDQ
ncbi:hypothetical protein MACH17_18560 [Phaeobacter inhibens]|uniref:portal protein n=1 Tax=Phaeobacter inhibens TaxID=221822 RepID=UPI0027576B06|nr:portal protein [Phaeobacter inhibens]GLO70339.1 hypothetical protein MACH17_18560 [Phaeobacter inhibens]